MRASHLRHARLLPVADSPLVAGFLMRGRMVGMKLLDAQEQSASGVAARGNPAMEDIVWPKGSVHGFFYFKDGYVPLPPDKFKDSDDWQPLHRPAFFKTP